MAKYKTLKSVAHNFGHSFLSDMNTVDSFQSFVPEVLFQLALEHDSPRVGIDFLRGAIEPAEFSVQPVQKSVALYRDWLPSLVESHGASWESVRSATLDLRFDLAQSAESNYRPGRLIPTFECTVEIADDRGVAHRGHPNHWWTT